LKSSIQGDNITEKMKEQRKLKKLMGQHQVIQYMEGSKGEKKGAESLFKEIAGW
jgi:hypothetical protein